MRLPFFSIASFAWLALLTVAGLHAQPVPSQTAPAAAPVSGVVIPGFWDPKRRQERPELPASTVIRFLTEVNYPPFDFAGPDGNPAGFNVDVARAVCEELKVGCTVQMRRFDTLVDALAASRGDAVIASLAKTPELRRRVDFTDPYYRSPARFVVRREAGPVEVLPEKLQGVPVGTVAGTAHEAYLKTLFAGVALRAYPDDEAARQALKSGEVKLLFGDGIQLAFWLNGSESEGCCTFVGGPFTESRFFGEGIGIAVRRGNDPLRQALNWGLFRLWETGRFADLWLRYFPVSPY
ncbi:MAG TPA: transporter substrate-binding domain-containing protein [Xanthobacteraceae bacterium]|nr:transporter substrate-binding domain-containing protein [Xanthobacteraceae bacterium]